LEIRNANLTYGDNMTITAIQVPIPRRLVPIKNPLRLLDLEFDFVDTPSIPAINGNTEPQIASPYIGNHTGICTIPHMKQTTDKIMTLTLIVFIAETIVSMLFVAVKSAGEHCTGGG